MVCSINIDETVLRPNVRPAKPKSKRGTITFIADIDERYGPNTRRNLTRGVNETDDPYRQPPQFRNLGNINLDLEAYRISIEAGGGGVIPIDLEVQTPSIDRGFSLQNLILELRDHVFEYEVGGDNILPADVNFDLQPLTLSNELLLNELILELTILEEGEGGGDISAVGKFNTSLAFSLPGNMVTTPDDPPPL